MGVIGATNTAAIGSRSQGSRRFDGYFLLSVVLLLLIGLLTLFSEGYGKDGDANFRKQLTFLVIGAVPLAVFAFVNPKVWQKCSIAVYLLNLALLALVLVKGHSSHDAQRWLIVGGIQFQPSEFAKLAAVLTLSSFYAKRLDRVGRFSTFALSLLYLSPSLILVLKQPHLGATLVLLVIWVATSIGAGVPAKFIAASFFCLGLVGVIAFKTPGIAHSYQVERLVAFMGGDEQSNDYQTTRAKIAFASGGVFGKGFLRGDQKQGRFIPEQQNDFIFTVIGEEGGLFGSLLVLGAFAFFFYRSWLVMLAATDPAFRMIVAGVLGLLGFHTVVNLGMIMKLVPVVGLWLPFISYGGTAIWLCLACVGLILGIRSRERPVLFL